MVIGVVFLVLAALVLAWRPRLRETDTVSERWRRDHVYRDGKS